MSEADRFYQGVIETQRSGDRARDLCDLERMCQAGAVQIALMIDEHLSFVD